MINEDSTPQEGLSAFFDFMWGEVNGFVYLPTMDPKSEEWKKVMYKWPANKEHVISHVLSSTAKGLHVFFAPAIFKEPNPHKQNVKGTNVVWTEFDGNAPQEWPEEGQEQAQDGPGAVPPPSVRVQSSTDGKEHVYWRLNTFEEDVSWFEGVNRSISYTYRADTSGWDANQILRPPYTTNYKHDLPVTIHTFDDIAYSRDNFKSLKPTVEIVSNSIDTDNLPKVEAVIAKYAWDEEHFKLFMDPSIPEGHRSSALMRLGYFGAEQGMSDEEIYALLDNADSRWGKFVKRTDRKKRLLDIVNRAKQKHPHASTDLTFSGLLDQKNVEVGVQHVYRFQDFLDEEIEVEWAIEGLLEEGGFGMIAAAPGVGKTQLAIQCACSMALGIEFVGYPIPRRRRSVFFSLEMGRVALRHFLDTISRQYSSEQRAVLQENLFVVPLGESLPVFRQESIQYIKSVLDDIQPDTIFVDSLVKLAGGELNESNATKINDFYSWIRSRYNCNVVVIHHNRKANGDNKKPVTLDDVYGAVFLTSDMTFVLTLYRDKEGPKNEIELREVKNRLALERDMVIIERNENLHFTVIDEEEKARREALAGSLLKDISASDFPSQIGEGKSSDESK